MIIRETVEGARARLKNVALDVQVDLDEMKDAFDDVRDEYNKLPYGHAPQVWRVKKLKEMVDWLYDVTKRFHRDLEGYEFLFAMFYNNGLADGIKDLRPPHYCEFEEHKDFEYWQERAIETHNRWKGGTTL